MLYKTACDETKRNEFITSPNLCITRNSLCRACKSCEYVSPSGVKIVVRVATANTDIDS